MLAASWDSFLKLSMNIRSLVYSGRSILMATLRSSSLSLERNTTAIPPSPILSFSSYLPAKILTATVLLYCMRMHTTEMLSSPPSWFAMSTSALERPCMVLERLAMAAMSSSSTMPYSPSVHRMMVSPG